MSDKPILFSAPMVLALLEGRKSMTRRVLKWQPPVGFSFSHLYHQPTGVGQVNFTDGERHSSGPLGFRPGDRLWVKETWAKDDLSPTGARYYATDAVSDLRKKRASIFMPRWASRLTLLVKEVRVERLQDISEADAVAEGIYQFPWSDVVLMLEDPADANRHEPNKMFYSVPGDDDEDFLRSTAAGAFQRLWESIHGPDAWEKNPWVTAISFDVVQDNIDQVQAS